MKKSYTAKIGIPDSLKQIDSESDREVLITASSPQEAHKLAMYKCGGLEEVLKLTINNKVVYNFSTGFHSEY